MAEEGDPGVSYGVRTVSKESTDAEQKDMDEDQLRKVFRQFDADGSGSIDVDELRDAMRMMGVKTSQNSAKKILATIDKDGNGTVEWEEFQMFFSKVRDPEEIKKILAAGAEKFLDYKQSVDTDPNFAKRFAMPPIVDTYKEFKGHNASVEFVCWLADGKFLTADMDGDMFIWEGLESPAKTPSVKISTDQCLYSAVLADSDGKTLLTGVGAKEDNIWLWDLEAAAAAVMGEEKKTPEPKQKLKGHGSQVYSLGLHENRICISGGKNGKLCVHELTRAEPLSEWAGHDSTIFSCDFDRDGGVVCTASSDGNVNIWDVKALRSTKQVGKIEDAAAGGTVFKAKWRNENEILQCGDDYCAKRWDLRNLATGPVSSYFGHTSMVRTLEVSPDGRFMVTACADGSSRVWLVDEIGFATERMEEAVIDGNQLETEKNQLETEMNQLMEKIESGDMGLGELDELKGNLAELKEHLAEATADRDYYGSIIAERERMNCVQAAEALEGHRLSCGTVAWRDIPGGDTAAILTGGQDQGVRSYIVDKTKLATLELLSKEGAES